MKSKYWILGFILLAAGSMACGISIDYPFQTVEVGPIEILELQVEAQEGMAIQDLSLLFGAGELELSPGVGERLVEGVARFNVVDFAPEVKISAGEVTIEQGNLDLEGLLDFDNVENQWDLRLGEMPMVLSIQAGAYKGRFELGGMRLLELVVVDGASDVTLSFSEPNRESMGLLRYESGASQVRLIGLANANFERMNFTSGAGDYTLDFSGELQQDGQVAIKSGFSNLELIIPSNLAAEVSISGAIQSVQVDGSWEQVGSTYYQDGNGPVLRIDLELGAGRLEIRNP